MQVNNKITSLLNLRLPFLMAPMFLVSNEKMMHAAIRSGIMGAFPSLNYRKPGELEDIIDKLHLHKLNQPSGQGSFGVNLIVQQSNPLYRKHLAICVERKVPFYITSLGNPKEVIEQAHSYGAKVFCDVTNLSHAEKSATLDCDGFIAVGMGAGGHAGNHPNYILVPSLKKHFPEVPVFAAGGVATGDAALSMLACGAEGVSIGSRFIATYEATVPDDYKQAIVDYGMEDIVMTERLSGTPCAVINTPYASKLGLRQNVIEKWLGRNPKTKKYFKMLVNIRGLKKLEEAVKPGNYHKLWCAGQSIEMVDEILSCEEIINNLEAEMAGAFNRMKAQISVL